MDAVVVLKLLALVVVIVIAERVVHVVVSALVPVGVEISLLRMVMMVLILWTLLLIMILQWVVTCLLAKGGVEAPHLPQEQLALLARGAARGSGGCGRESEQRSWGGRGGRGWGGGVAEDRADRGARGSGRGGPAEGASEGEVVHEGRDLLAAGLGVVHELMRVVERRLATGIALSKLVEGHGILGLGAETEAANRGPTGADAAHRRLRGAQTSDGALGMVSVLGRFVAEVVYARHL